MRFPCIDHEQNRPRYGYVYRDGKHQLYHRLVFQQAYGYLPEVVMHSCDNPRCINPLHLVAGTHKANSDDKIAKGRQKWDGRPKVISDPELVRQIADAPGSLNQLAAQYGVSRDTIHRIKRGNYALRP